MRQRLNHGLILLCVIVAGLTCFYLCYRYDNKYTYQRPDAVLDMVSPDMESYGADTMFYLVDGWSFYKDKLLTPENIKEYSPDEYMYIGRYGGFDMGDPQASPYGKGTYRTVIVTDGIERQYALELTQIYSNWQLWVNGKLMQSVRAGGENPPSPDSRMVTFTAKDAVEIVVAVSDDRHFYSGMVYPPAFGSPEAVGRMTSLRLLIHGAACGLAFFTAALCLILGIGCGFARPYRALCCLCICFAGSTAWPVFQALGFYGDILPLAERLFRYGIFVAVIWIQAKECHLPKLLYQPVVAAGIAICISILLQPMVRVEHAYSLMLYSDMLSFYKVVTALWLTATGLWALSKGRRCSMPLLSGSLVFACSLIIGRLFPLHEPVILGWFPEMAGGFYIFVSGGYIWYDTLRVYKEGVEARAQSELSQMQLRIRAEHSAMQQDYVRRTQEQLHESKNRLALIRHYLDTGELDKLDDYVDRLTLDMACGESFRYSGNSLIDAILASRLGIAAKENVYTELDIDTLPVELSINDEDISSALINILDNAIEACKRLPEDEERWMYLQVHMEGKSLVIACKNSSPAGSSLTTWKDDKLSHGFGLNVLKKTADKSGGSLKIRNTEDSFSVEMVL